MGQFSSWSMYFKHPDGSDIREVMNEINAMLSIPGTTKSIFDSFSISYNSNYKEAFVEWETTSYSAQDYAEHDLVFLSEQYPDLVFQAHGSIDNGDPDFYINARAGELEWNYPEVTYPGFKTIFYDESDKSQSPIYTAEEIKLAISDMTKLTEMLSGKIASDSTPTTKVAEWALREVLKSYYQEEVE